VPEHYQIEFYEDARGRSQIKEWLLGLRKSNPKAYATAWRLLERLQLEGPEMKPPATKHIQGPIWELRHNSGIRIYYWRQGKRLFVAAAGELKKRDKADPKLIQYALRAYQEWQEGS